MNNKDLKDEILRQAHNSQFSIHPGSTKMYQNLKRYYQREGMKRDVATWTLQCILARWSKEKGNRQVGYYKSFHYPNGSGIW